MRRFRYMFQSSPAPANGPKPIPSSKYVSKNSVMLMNYGQPQQQQQQTFVSTTQRRRSCRCCQKDMTPPENDNTGEDVVGGIEDIHTDGGTGQVCRKGSNPCLGFGVSGCTLIDNSNICCTDWNADGSGCTDQSNVCGVGVDVSLCGRTYLECSGGKISQDAIWELAYFFSGGERYDGSGPIPYDMDDILHSTPLCQEGTPTPKPSCKKRSGADPSCGASDFATLSTCILGVPLSAAGSRTAGTHFPIDASRTSYNYPAQDMSSALHNLMTNVDVKNADASNNGKICYTIEASNNKGVIQRDANGTVQFVANSDASGMVPVLAHGTFGVPLVAAGCTSNVYTGGSTEEIKTAYFKRTQALAAILGAGSCLSGGPIGECLPTNTTYVTYYKAESSISNHSSNYICLITEKAFLHAGLGTLYKKLAPNNGGVGVAWGHGVKNGACGSFYFLKQGNTKGWPTTSPDASYNDISYANNVVLLAQIGMRAWSGEWNDSIGTQVPPFDTSTNKFNDSLDGASQSYITENLPYNSDSTTCLQPLMSDVDIRAVDRLINLICPTLPLNRYGHHPCDIPQQNGICKCDLSATDMKGVSINCPHEGVCENASYKTRELCDSYKPWGCGKWIQQTCKKSGSACNYLSDCNPSTDSSLNCGSCNNGKCQATKCIGKSAPCDKNGLQCCDATRDNIVCKRTDDNHKNPYICQTGTNKGGQCAYTDSPKNCCLGNNSNCADNSSCPQSCSTKYTSRCSAVSCKRTCATSAAGCCSNGKNICENPSPDITCKYCALSATVPCSDVDCTSHSSSSII